MHYNLQALSNNTHLVHPLRLWPGMLHAELLLLRSSLWPPAATIAPMRVSGRRYMARKMHYTVRSNPLLITCYPVFPVSSPSPSRCSRFSTYPTRSVRLTFSLRWPALPCFPCRCAHGASILRGTCSPRCSSGPPRPLPCALASFCPPLPLPVRAKCRAVCMATPFPLFCPLPPCTRPLGPPGALVLSFPSANLFLPPPVRFPAKHSARHYAG